MSRTDCTEPECLYSRAIYLLPLWAVQTVESLRCLYNTACPLLSFWAVGVLQSLKSSRLQLKYYPLWAVQAVQSLSACTIQLNLYSPMGRTDYTKLQCL